MKLPECLKRKTVEAERKSIKKTEGFIMNFKRTKRISKMIILAMAVVMVCGVCMVSYAASAGKVGNYCSMFGASSSSGSTCYVSVDGKNNSGSSKYMTVNLYAYNNNGNIARADYESGVVANGGTLTAALSQVQSDYRLRSTTSIYRGTSSATGQLEYLEIYIN